MKVLIAASECVPFAKTGGLADVSGSLPKALKRLKCDVIVIMPKYKKIDNKKFKLRKIVKGMKIPMGITPQKYELADVYVGQIEKGLRVYFIGNEEYYGRDELYRTSSGDYHDNDRRFIFFSRAVLEAAKAIDFKPDVIHCHDWQTGLIPVYLKTLYQIDAFYQKTSTVFTIHNIAYQGMFDKYTLFQAGLGEEEFTLDKMEYYGQVNFLKAGLVYSDVLNTVSKRYSIQIRETEEFGRGMQGVLSARKEDLFGIINGIDYSIWDASKDKFIQMNYDVDSLNGKTECKKALLKESALRFKENIPLIGIVSRLDPQKGFDVVEEAIENIMAMDLQMIILGTGDQRFHDMLLSIEKRYREKIKSYLKFDNALAHKIYAGSDMFLMPSRFEPCGLGQFIGMAYGTVPVVNPTGGLADTVSQFNPVSGKGTGFLLKTLDAEGLVEAVKHAVTVFNNKKVWMRLVRNIMQKEFSWDAAAREYIQLYKRSQRSLKD